MAAWDSLLATVAKRIGDATGSVVEASELIPPPKPDLGDIAFGCFKIAKTQGKNPAEVAKEIVAKLSKDKLIESVSAAGPYVNVVLNAGGLIDGVVKDVEKAGKGYGSSKDGKGKQIVIEYANPNTHKETHVGHLRNFTYGAALVRLFDVAGWKVEPVSYINDMGANVSKCLWWFVKQHGADVKTFDAKKIPTFLKKVSANERNGRYLSNVYVEAGRQLEEHPEWKEEVSFIHAALEKKDPAWIQLWDVTRQWCLEEFKNVFAELGVIIKKQYFESEFAERSQEFATLLEEKKIAVKSEGALIVDLEEEKLGVAMIRKSDGTLLYLVKDLALCEQKLKDYPKAERSLIVTDVRQKLNFQQLFALLKRLGMPTPFEFAGYEIVTLKEGVMSGRKGTVVMWQDLRDRVLEYATKETRERHPEWSEEQVQKTAWSLMMGGIKFGMLKQDSNKIIVFDWEKSLSFDGDTGPYIQYAATRMASILKKAGSTGKKGDLTKLTEPAEKRLALQMAAFPDACRRAAIELRPAIVAQWCITTAQRMSDFYRDVKVIDAPEEIKEARLRLVSAVRSVLAQGLDLLGIPLPDEM